MRSTRWWVAVAAVAILAAAPGCGFGGSAHAAPADRSRSLEGELGFRVEIDGVSSATFRSVDGLSVELEVIEYRSGSDDPLTRKRPGRIKCGDITLKRGLLSADRALFDWIQSFEDGSGERRSMSVALLRAGEEVRRWNCFECFPKSWKVSPGAEGEIALEEVVIAVERIELAGG